MRSLTLLPVLGSLLAIAEAAPTHVKRATWAPAEGGCWSDNTDYTRSLQHGMGGFDDLTPESCQALCEAAGFSLAGVEYGRECYCGNTIMGNNRPSTAGICNMACAGDATQICGGPNAINIFVKDDYEYTTGPASAVASYNEYENPQCWLDTPRILPSSPATSIPGDQMTVQKCIDGCAAAGFSSAGLEYGRECYCGNLNFTPDPSQALDISQCNMPCAADGSEFCGGPSRVLIYTKPEDTTPTDPTGPWTPVEGGCWTDSIDGVRALEYGVGGYDDTTPASCQALCDAQGFNLAGVEYGRECYCGNTIMGSNHPSSSICNMPCAGDSTQTCGGANAINIFVKDDYPYTSGPASVLNAYNGYYRTQCWLDYAGNRVLKDAPATAIPIHEMTVQKCIDGCAAAGFSSAGVEFGRECYCGDITYPPSQSYPITECNMPCTGDASEICGGDARVLIYYNAPIKTYEGTLIVSDSNGIYLGHISKHPSVDGHYVYGTDDDALHVTFDGPDWGVQVENIEFQTVDSDVTAYSFLGLVQGHDNTGNDLGSGSAEYAELTSTNTVAAGSPAQNVGNSYSDAASLARNSQSHVWNINLIGGDTTFTWINDDNTPATVQMFGQNNIVYISGDSAAYNALHTDTITPLRLKFMESF